MVNTKIIEKKDYKLVVESLEKGKVVAFPTETVMGLAVDAFNNEAYNELIEIKKRPANKSFPFVVSNVDKIKEYAFVNDKANKIINKFMPGPLTLVLKKKDNIDGYITNNKDTIAIRIPDDEVVLRILNEFKKPILLTSANKSGEVAANNSNECYEIFKGELEYIIEGSCKIKEASTILDLTNEEIKVIREGKITLEEINNFLEE